LQRLREKIKEKKELKKAQVVTVQEESKE
jgi:hypothetical protein